jgi:hypothetical protein
MLTLLLRLQLVYMYIMLHWPIKRCCSGHHVRVLCSLMNSLLAFMQPREHCGMLPLSLLRSSPLFILDSRVWLPPFDGNCLRPARCAIFLHRLIVMSLPCPWHIAFFRYCASRPSHSDQCRAQIWELSRSSQYRGTHPVRIVHRPHAK